MIIWNGWGILGVLVPGLAAGGMAGLASALDMPGATFVAVGLVLGGIGSFFLGKWFNETRAEQQATQWRNARQQELYHLVHNGQFQVAAGYAQPRSMEEANQQAQALLEAEHREVAKRLRNRHTVFWIPMQWVGLVFVVIGLGLAVTSLLG